MKCVHCYSKQEIRKTREEYTLSDSTSTHKAYTTSWDESLKSLVQKKRMQGLVEDGV